MPAAGYTGSAEGEENARELGTVAGETACTSLGAAPVAGLCGQIGAAVFGAVYEAWNTDPSKGTMIYPAWTAEARNQARRAGLATALDKALAGLEAVTLRPRAQLVGELRARGVEIVETTALDRSGRRYGDQYGAVDVPPITFELAPPSWFTKPPYPPTAATEYMAARGYDREGKIELEQWADKLVNATFALTAVLGKPALVKLGGLGRVFSKAKGGLLGFEIVYRPTAVRTTSVPSSSRSWGRALAVGALPIVGTTLAIANRHRRGGAQIPRWDVPATMAVTTAVAIFVGTLWAGTSVE